MGNDFMEQVLLLQTDTVSSEVRKSVCVCVSRVGQCTLYLLVYLVMESNEHEQKENR